MQLAPARPVDWLDPATLYRIRIALLVAVAIVNAYLVGMALLVEPMRAPDWNIMQRAAALAGSPELYELRETSTFVWSPVSAYLLKALEPLSFEAWQLITIGVALAMPTWRLRLLVLVSWPFWTDVLNGNLLTLIFLASVYAWRGSRLGTAALFAFTLLIPRPLVVPMAAWILWKRPESRWMFGGLFVVHAALVLWTGLGPEWIATLIHVGPELMDSPFNRGLSRFIGYWWLPIGAAIGWWLFKRGHVGLAGLAVSPYVWSYYLLWLLPEVNRVERRP